MTLESLFSSPMALPAVPKVVQQLIQSFSREDVSTSDIAGQLAADPVLSAKTLRLANSAYFHVSRRVSSMDDALRMLGFVMVRNMVLGSGVAQAFKATPGLDLKQFWRHSLHTACAARWLAQAGEHNADLAFTVGLIHGVGHLVMHCGMPTETMKAFDADCPPLAAERAAREQQQWGYHHGTVGAELARRWNFPEEVSAALMHSPDPLGVLGSALPHTAVGAWQPMAALIHLAAWRARVAALDWSADQAAECCPSEAARLAGLSVAWKGDLNTLTLDPPGGGAAMPPLAELSDGLEAMFE